MLNQLKVTHKIVLLIAAVALPLAAWTLYATLSDTTRAIHFARQEQHGNALQRPLVAILQALPQHQTLAQAATHGDLGSKTLLLNKQIEIDQSFADLANAQAKYGDELQFTDDTLGKSKTPELAPRALQAAWQTLKQTDPNAPDLAAQHQQIAAILRGQIRHLGQTSGLACDPDADSAPLADLTLRALPATMARLGRAAGSQTTDGGSPAPGVRPPASTLAALLQQSDLDRIQTDIDTTLAADAGTHGLSPTLAANLAAPRQACATAITEYATQLQAAGSQTTDGGSPASALAAQTATYDLWKAAVDELDRLLSRRISAHSQARLIRTLGVAATLVAAIIAAVLLARNLTRPLAGLTQATQRILRGETTVRVPVFARDELGALAGSLNALLDSRNKVQAAVEAENKRLQTNIQELLVVVSDASDGNLGVRARVSEGALGNICDALNLMLENVGGIIANAKSASAQVASASSGITAVAQDLEKGEQRQTQEILTTSEGVRDLNGKAQKVLENCQAATQAAANGRAAAELGVKAVREVIKGMEKIRENTQANAKKIKRLGDRSMEISGIVKVIGDISAKTDMLALNASIEAARAGEQGRGFTVVAEQVRGLADRTKTLTNQIENLVNHIQKETGEAVAQMETQTQEVEAGARAAQSAGGTLENIVTVSSESSDLVSQINQSASQQAVRTQEMLATVENINQVVAESAAKVRETRSTSEQLLALSAELNKRLAQFETAQSPVECEPTT